MTQALAVAGHTLLEIRRRRLLLVVVVVGLVLTVGLWIAPHAIPHNDTNRDRLIVLLSGLEQVVPTAMLLCALAVGMTVINHDLDSGAAVSIFARPVSRASYALGKLLASVGVLLVVGIVFTGGSLIGAALNGGGVYDVLFWNGAALAANSMLLMLLAVALTVYLNNVIAAAIVLVFNFAADQVLTLHAMAQNNVITDATIKALVNTVYWAVPHVLSSNLQRQIEQMRLDNGKSASSTIGWGRKRCRAWIRPAVEDPRRVGHRRHRVLARLRGRDLPVPVLGGAPKAGLVRAHHRGDDVAARRPLVRVSLPAADVVRRPPGD